MAQALLMEKMNGKKIYEWILRNHPPLTWNFITVKIGDYFLANEVDPFYIQNSTVFNAKLVEKIDQVLRLHYDSNLPNNVRH